MSSSSSKWKIAQSLVRRGQRKAWKKTSKIVWCTALGDLCTIVHYTTLLRVSWRCCKFWTHSLPALLLPEVQQFFFFTVSTHLRPSISLMMFWRRSLSLNLKFGKVWLNKGRREPEFYLLFYRNFATGTCFFGEILGFFSRLSSFLISIWPLPGRKRWSF